VACCTKLLIQCSTFACSHMQAHPSRGLLRRGSSTWEWACAHDASLDNGRRRVGGGPGGIYPGPARDRGHHHKLPQHHTVRWRQGGGVLVLERGGSRGKSGLFPPCWPPTACSPLTLPSPPRSTCTRSETDGIAIYPGSTQGAWGQKFYEVKWRVGDVLRLGCLCCSFPHNVPNTLSMTLCGLRSCWTSWSATTPRARWVLCVTGLTSMLAALV
jgi:hypothetical protein